jgi:two-component system sensor histidine kinase CreC
VKITWRILFGFLFCTTAGFYFLVHWLLGDLRPRYLEAVEETLVDASQLLASQVEADSRNGQIQTTRLKKAFDGVYKKNFEARIYDLTKTHVALRVYITDAKGIVLFDSKGQDLGKDYSHWNDVLLTLQGKYGARSTRVDPEDPSSNILYVASPIVLNGKIAGVLTVAKTTDAIGLFVENTRRKVFLTCLTVFFSILFLTALVSFWVAQPIRKLTEYAKAVGGGNRMPLPQLGRNEMGDLGRAFEDMRQALEGKKYVEQYVQLLTHEVKGPLSAIRGAAELLEEKMPPAERKKFLKNILSESARLKDLVDRMLLLSSLENRREGIKSETLDIQKLAEDVLESFQARLKSGKLSAKNRVPAGMKVKGDPFLLRQALSNLVENAVEFSPPGGSVTLSAEKAEGSLVLRVEDQGPGVPSFALDRVFEKFYSLQRPHTGRKSSGLGLSLVKEVASLHGGGAKLENRPEGGARAILILPFYRS